MTLHKLAIAVIAGTVALQVTPCQSLPPALGVSMKVTTAIGVVGNACESFDCLAHQTLANLGEQLPIEIYAKEGDAYVLFFGMPVGPCQQVPQLNGALAVWAPIITLEIGLMPGNLTGGACNVPFRATSFVVPTMLPLGMQFRLQSFATGLGNEGLAFSRAVEVHTR